MLNRLGVPETSKDPIIFTGHNFKGFEYLLLVAIEVLRTFAVHLAEHRVRFRVRLPPR